MQRCMGCMTEFEEGLSACPHCGYVPGTAPKEAYHLTPGSLLNQRYTVGRVLGYGGFGVTYIGYDARLGRLVAIKEFLPSTFATRMPGDTVVTVYAGEATEQFGAGLTRFIEEAQRLAQFNGVPGIVDIYDTFAANSTAYIVMEYLKGQDIKNILTAKGPMPYEEARDIILKICDTLAPVHASGIIHRDISPDNIFITDDGEVKLLDFGASRYATSVNSKSLSVILKSGYAPEEQYRSRGEQGPWSDVYALAATFYKMLTGTTPDDAMERAIRDELKEPSKLDAELPKSAENAIMNALNVKQQSRTQSAEEFKTALLADGVQRVKVKNVKSDAGQTPKWVKFVVGAAAVVLVAFGVLTLTGVVDFGQGNILADTFGSAVPEGYVNTPGIVNKMEEDAREQVKDVGLSYLIVGTSYDDKIAKGRILTQSPTPGQVIELGSEIEVTISGGSKEDATQAATGGEGGAVGEDGEPVSPTLPDLTYMSAIEAMAQINATEGYSFTEPLLTYSDDIAEGLVISQEVHEDNSVTLTVSGGRWGDDSNYGEPRTPLLVQVDGQVAVKVIPSSPSNSTRLYMYALSFSTDGGASWLIAGTNLSSFTDESLEQHRLDEFSQVRFNGYYPGDYRYQTAPNGPQPVYLPVAELLALHHPEAAGKEVLVRVDCYLDGRGTPAYSRVLDQPFSFDYEGPTLEITGMNYMEWDELTPYVESGAVAEGSWLAERHKYQMKYGHLNKPSDNPQIVNTEEYVVALSGPNFVKGQSYRSKVMQNANVYGYPCIEDGIVVVDAVNNGPKKIWLYNCFDITVGEGLSMHQQMQRGTVFTMDLPGIGESRK